jgi:IPT/TIG domain-containing protein
MVEKMVQKRLLKISLLGWAFPLLLAACGGGGGGAPPVTSQPILNAALPSQASPGEMVTLQGTGFSADPNENIVVFGGTSAASLSYRLIPSDQLPPSGAVEEITFQVPGAAPPGATNLLVLVKDNPSNAIPFTVESP